VDHVAFGYWKDRFGLVIDAGALREAGLSADAPVPLRPLASADDRAAPWEERNLAAVPVGTVALLTTRRQRDAWRGPDAPFGLPGRDERLPEAIRRAVADAAEHGQDPSGRFRSALTWLRPEAAPARGAGSNGAA